MTTTGEKLVTLLKTQVGKPYVWGATGPSGFDCSGLITWGARLVGYKGLPRTSQEMRKAGTSIPLADIAVGDLVTFTYADRRGGNPGPGNHVALYAGGGQVVQASGSRVNVSPIDTGHVDRVIRIFGNSGAMQASDVQQASTGSSSRRAVYTAQQAGYSAATKVSAYGLPVNPFKMPGWVASGGNEGANSTGGVQQAGLLDGAVSLPWDGVSTVILSSLFVLAGVVLVVAGAHLAVGPSAGGMP